MKTQTQSTNQSPIRQSQDTKKIQRKCVASFHPLSFFGSVSHLAKGVRKYRVATYFERVEGPPFLLYLTYVFTKVRRTHLRIK
jgi:hypothetical protein